MTMLKKVKDGLIVSCQASENEPLHSSYIMSRLAVAAEQGGAVGIRANSVIDIIAIQATTSLPIVGIIKRDYEDSPVFITATMLEVNELMTTGCEMIALDATSRVRPNGESLAELVSKIKLNYPDILLMADIATVDEALNAESLGFDCISTTLIGYTAESEGHDLAANHFEKLRTIIEKCTLPVIAEGNVDTPEKAQQCKQLGVHSIVVGSAITRPQLITEKFVTKMNEKR